MKDGPKQAIECKKCIKSIKTHHPAHTKHNSSKRFFSLWNYRSNRHITPPKMLGGIFLRLIELIFLSSVCYFKKLQRYATFGKLQTSAIVWTHHQGVSSLTGLLFLGAFLLLLMNDLMGSHSNCHDVTLNILSSVYFSNTLLPDCFWIWRTHRTFSVRTQF